MKKYISIIVSIVISIYCFTVAEADNIEEPDSADNEAQESVQPEISVNIIEMGNNDAADVLENNEDIKEESGTDNSPAVSAEVTNDENNIELLSLSDSWSASSGMITQRADCDLITAQGMLYAVGGYGENGYVNSIERYSSDDNHWENVTVIPNMPKGFEAIAAENKIYIIGGYRNGEYLKEMQVYDIDTNEWSVIEMSSPRDQCCALYADNKIYIFGGRNRQGINTNCEYYDLINNMWCAVSGFDESVNRIGAKAQYINGYICVYGGFDKEGVVCGVDMYLASNPEFTQNLINKNKYDDISIAWGKEKAIVFALNNVTNESIVREITVNDDVRILTPKFNEIPTKHKFQEYVIYNGYLHCAGGYNKTNKAYLNNVSKYSVLYGDFVSGEGTINTVLTAGGNELILNVETGKTYMMFINVKNMASFDGYTFNINYDEDVFTLMDGCAFNPNRYRSAVKVPKTDISITRVTNTGMSFVCTESLNHSVTKTVNAVIFKADTSGQRKIVYSLTKGGIQ